MSLESLRRVDWTDSYILGWKPGDLELTLYLQILLREDHPEFAPYDKTTEHGCYRLGVLEFTQITMMTGLPLEEHLPKWDEQLLEHHDAAEIDELTVVGTQVVIDAGDSRIQVDGGSAVLHILAEDGRHAFGAYQ